MKQMTMEDWVKMKLNHLRSDIGWILLGTQHCKWMNDINEDIKNIDSNIVKLLVKMGENENE